MAGKTANNLTDSSKRSDKKENEKRNRFEDAIRSMQIDKSVERYIEGINKHINP